MTRSTSDVATCRSSASFNSRWSRATSGCGSFGEVRPAFGVTALLRFAFTGLRLGGLAAQSRDLDLCFMLAPKLSPGL
jgi:hypothetical protein